MRVTRIDHPEAMLVAPEQQFFVRENLKLRLLNARLALLSRQFEIAQSDIRDAQAALDRYFERGSKRVVTVARSVAPGVCAGAPDQPCRALTRHWPRCRRGRRPLTGPAMRSVIWLVLLFVAAVVAATTLGRNDGLVSLYWSGWRLDVSLNLFVIGLVLSCLVLLLAMRALQSLVSLPERAHEWRVQRRERAAQAALREALAEYFGARYSRARKAASRAVAIHEATPELVSDLQTPHAGPPALGRQPAPPAGPAASATDSSRSCSACVAHASALQRGSDDGVPLMAAEWALDDRDAARALSLLAELPPGVARRTQALRLKLQAQRLAGQPDEALHTARLLAKHQAFSQSAAQVLLRSLAGETLAATRDAEQLDRAWQALDSADHADAIDRRPRRHVRRAPGRARTRPALAAARLAAPGRARPRRARRGRAGADRQPAGPACRLAAAHRGGTARPAQRRRGAGRRRQRLRRAPAVGQGTRAAGAWRHVARAGRHRARRAAWRRLAGLARAEGDEARAARCHEAAAASD